jgi:hypothetical protein
MVERYDFHVVKERVRFLDLMAWEGVAMRRAGAHFVGVCPFHDERSGSFTVHGPGHDHAHCYGCGWHGDIFDFVRERRGVGFAEAVASLASLASISPVEFEVKRKEASKMTRMTRRADDPTKKPALPRMRPLTEGEVAELAKLRKLSVAGIAAAARDKRVGACEWPQFEDRHGCWQLVPDASTAWVVTDGERRVAQFRRMSGEKYTMRSSTDSVGRQIKAWTKGGPAWPLGAAEMGERACVLLVEGGADMLAAYHFLALFGRLRRVAVIAMLGAGNRIAETALPYFKRKRVRIMMDADEPDARGVSAGLEAAARWTEQLTKAGAAVETFSLEGLLKKDGSKVKDLNDLAEVDEGAWCDPELREAFFNFDF